MSRMPLLLLLLLCSCRQDPRDPRYILRKHRAEMDRAAIELSRLQEPKCIDPSFGYNGCLHKIPEGSFVSIDVADSTLIFVPDSELRVRGEFQRMLHGAGLRCPGSEAMSWEEDLGDGWFVGRFFTPQLGLNNSLVRGKLPVTDVPYGMHVHLEVLERPGREFRSVELPIGQNGEFCGDNLPPGKRRLLMNLNKGPSGSMPYPMNTALTPVFELAEHEEVDLGSLTLPARLPVDTVEVTVQFDDGRPVAGARVRVDDNDYGSTDVNGVARVVVIPRSGHSLWAWEVRTQNLFVTRRWEGYGGMNGRIGKVKVYEYGGHPPNP